MQVLIIYISPPEFLFIKLLAKSVKKIQKWKCNLSLFKICLQTSQVQLCAVFILFSKSKIQAKKISVVNTR